MGTLEQRSRVATPPPGERRPPELRLFLTLFRPYPPAASGSAQKLKSRSGGWLRRQKVRQTASVSLAYERLLTEAVKLFVCTGEAHTTVDAKEDDGVTPVLAVELVCAGRLEQPVGLD